MLGDVTVSTATSFGPAPVLVHRDVLGPFTERYVAAAEALVLGDPTGAVDMGPLVSAAQLAKTEAAVFAERPDPAMTREELDAVWARLKLQWQRKYGLVEA